MRRCQAQGRESLAIGFRLEERDSCDGAPHHAVQGAGCVEPSVAGHGGRIGEAECIVKYVVFRTNLYVASLSCREPMPSHPLFPRETDEAG
jgi:hypothetical protein